MSKIRKDGKRFQRLCDSGRGPRHPHKGLYGKFMECVSAIKVKGTADPEILDRLVSALKTPNPWRRV